MGFLQHIHDASKVGDIKRTTSLELLDTITAKVRENSFASAAALIIHAENELVKDITERHLPTSAPQEESTPKPVRTELPESSSFFSEPWGSLMKVMHDLVRYGQSDTPFPSGDNLSATCKALYTYVCAHLEDGKSALLHEKDLLVAMSGVINLRAADIKDVFGLRLIKDIEASAPKAQPDVSINSTLQLLSEILKKSGIHYLRDEISILDAERVQKARRGEQTDPSQKVVLDVVRFLTDKIIAGSFGNSEHAVVSTWKSVLDYISKGMLKLESGELTSGATKEIRILQEQEFNGTSKSVCGRKMDLHLHLNGLELNNSEFKAVGVDIEEIKRQSRRNIRVNKAIMVYLQRHAKFDFQNDDCLVFLDVSGYTGTIVYLRRYEDIHRRLCDMQQEVEDMQAQALDESFLQQERITPPLQPRDLDVIVVNSPKRKRSGSGSSTKIQTFE
ncbi:hypothetical protein BGZ83_007261 [Gryganskiella cystojenkinii]|nr:hypothetical protein BGZ83_007261 [Gryganskiella cystojenkinii]